jgi:mannose-6-phosphate isomerase-like protein (cupin superfamily)
MQWIKQWGDHLGDRPDKFYKTTLFSGDHLLLGLNCLEPGQTQPPHIHADQDKFYLVLAGVGRFWLGDEQVEAGEGAVVWAPAGLSHGVANQGERRLTLLVGIAPSP